MTPPTSLRHSERDLRMVTTLLASCDPLRTIATGGAAEDYVNTAAEVLAVLATSPDVTDVLLTLPEADVEDAHRFAAVVLQWWQSRVVAFGRRVVVLS